jgi:hypothetical protein
MSKVTCCYKKNTNFSEQQDLTSPQLSSSSNSVYAVSSSSEVSGSPAWEAFTTNGGTVWQTSVGSDSSGNISAYLYITFSKNHNKVNQYYFCNYNGGGSSPSSWVFEGSYDNDTWYVLDTRSNEDTGGPGWHGYNVSDTTKYMKYYRFHFTKTVGTNTTMSLTDCHLHGKYVIE